MAGKIKILGQGVRRDSWSNLWTGVGKMGVDRRTVSTFDYGRRLMEQEVRAIYREDGIGRRIIEIPTLAMMRAGFNIVGDPENMVLARFEETRILSEISNMIRWSKLYGGALGIIGADDGQKYEMPLNEGRIRTIGHLHVFNRWRVTYTTADLYNDPMNPKFGSPEYFHVKPLWGNPFVVHESRTVRMDGNIVDDFTRIQNWGWGDSVLQSCWEGLRAVCGVFDSAESIVDSFVTETMSIQGLADLIAEGQEGVEKILQRLKIHDKTKHTMNMNLVDAGTEKYEKLASSVAGLSDILDRFMMSMSSKTGIPVTLLFGRSAAGLNATGDGDISNYDDQIRSEQAEWLKPMIEKLARLTFLAQDGFFDGREPDNWYVEFNPLREPTEKEKADLEKTQAETLHIFITDGVIDPEEVREIQEIQDRYGIEGEFPGEGPEAPKEELLEPAQTPPQAGDAQDGLNPAQRCDSILEACRKNVLDAIGRRRGDAFKFIPLSIVLDKRSFKTVDSARSWVEQHGFEAPKVDETRGFFRFRQRDSASVIRGSVRSVSVVNGVEIVLGKPKVG